MYTVSSTHEEKCMEYSYSKLDTCIEQLHSADSD